MVFLLLLPYIFVPLTFSYWFKIKQLPVSRAYWFSAALLFFYPYLVLYISTNFQESDHGLKSAFPAYILALSSAITLLPLSMGIQWISNRYVSKLNPAPGDK
ncbi:MAG: hypothetical protein ACOH2A_15865 [Sphingobacteriaceae bacterium]